MELKELLEVPIDSFWKKTFKDRFVGTDEISLKEFDEISKSVLISPLNEITFRGRKSQEYNEFKKTINEDKRNSFQNGTPFNHLLKFMNNINDFNEEIITKLSQFVYYDFYFNETLCGGTYPPYRTLETQFLDKILLLNDSLKEGFELKEEDKLSTQEIMTIGYILGQWGHIEASKMVFELNYKCLDFIDNLLQEGYSYNGDIYTPIIIPQTPPLVIGWGTKENNIINDVKRFKLSNVHGLGKIHQLEGEYQKAIDLYIGGLKYGNKIAYATYNRHLEDLTEAYKCAKILNDYEQCSKIYDLVKKHFIDLYDRSEYYFSIFHVGLFFRDRHIEISAESPLMSLMIRHHIFNTVSYI